MSDATIIAEVEKIKARLRRNSIVVILVAAGALFLIVSFFATMGNSNKRIKELKAENKVLARQMDSLNRRFTIDSMEKVDVAILQEQVRQEREEVLADIRNLSSQVKTFQLQYAKGSNYKSIPADSVTRLFNRTFDLK